MRGSNPGDPRDPVLKCLTQNTLLLYVEGSPGLTQMLVERFRKNPKPMYYQPAFLEAKWAEYKSANKIAADDDVDPDGFAIWGFEQLLHHRVPLYEAMARNFGYRIQMSDVPGVASGAGFVDLLSSAIDRNS